MKLLLKLKTWYWVHKWLSIFTGIAILIWLVSGLIMTASSFISGPALPATNTPQFDFGNVIMTPADAVAQLEAVLGQTAAVDSVRIRQVRDVLAYQVVMVNGESHLIDVETGQLFEITPEVARQIAQDSLPEASVSAVERLEHHDLGYAYGPVPAYRVVFDDNSQTYLHVAIETGETQWNNGWSRFTGVGGMLHTFEIFHVLNDGREQLITGLMWASSIITLIAAIVGYYLALPRRWQVWYQRRG